MRPVGGEVQRDAEAEDGEEEEDRDDEEELQDAAVENDEHGPDFEAVDEQQPQGLDDEQLLANLLALPGRQRLPLLSEVPVPDSLWFTRDRGKLTRVISTIFRRKFDGPFFSWTVTPIDKQERYFRTFASKYYWDQEITELVREHFTAIAINRMKGIVSRAKTSGIRPIWIDGDLWKEMWLHWDTTEAIERSTTASNSRNSDRNGLGPHKHRSGQSSYLTIQQDMEEELGRPVSFAEVFKQTHTLPDGSYVDQKAKQVYEDYDKTLQEVREQARGEGPDASDDSENTTQRQMTVHDLNDIFLKVTHIDPKGNPYGMGQLSQVVIKKKRKASDASPSKTALEAMQDELKSARQKISDFEAENKRRDEEDKRRDAELKLLRQSQSRISEFEKMIQFMKTDNPRLAAYLTQSSVLDVEVPAQAPPTLPEANF